MASRIFFKYLFLLIVLFGSCSKPVDENSPRGYDEEKISRLNDTEKYNYDKEFEVDTSEATDLGWFARALGSIFSAIAYLFNNVLGYLFLIVLVFLLVYLVARNSDALFIRRKAELIKPVKISQTDNIEDIDYEKLLSMALQEKDFSLAIRYHFLQCLKILQKAKLIHWHREKTNYEYLLEVPEGYYQPLVQLIYIYEYVWYGKFNATRETYQKLALEAEKIQLKRSTT